MVRDHDKIVHRHVARICLPAYPGSPTKRTTSTPGETLRMEDNTVWFHPYTGEAPVQLVSRKII